MKKTIHHFNPETDYALAHGGDFYTPPSSVVGIRRAMALLPSRYAEDGDIILVHKEDKEAALESVYMSIARAKDISIVDETGLSELHGYRIQPWGWNHALLRWLQDCGYEGELPERVQIDKLRMLSHRRTTIPFISQANDSLPSQFELPSEFHDAESALNFMNDHPGCYFKAPWSSSGRGVIYTGDLELRHIEPWLRGVIRSQGSVMAEPGYKRRLDLASEWYITGSSVEFLGVSVFEASRRGKYHHNIEKSQSDLMELINSVSNQDPGRVFDTQNKILSNLIAPHYSGPVGIDMLVTDGEMIHPCVEINLRMTMGMLNLFNQTKSTK